MRTLTIAVVQHAPTWGDVPAAVAHHVAAVRGAAEQGVRLALFPELSLTGYDLAFLTSDAGAGAWLHPDDPRLDPLRAVCADTGVTALVGAPVRVGSQRVLAAVRVEPDGGLHVHGKTHLHGAEHAVFDAQPASAPFDLDGWRVAAAICFDLATPAHAAAAAERGTDLYVAGVVYDAGDERRFDVHGAARAMDHRMVVAAANTVGDRPGATSCGASAVWHPDGSVLARADTAAQTLVVELDLDEVRAYQARDRAVRA
ncbi:carbon-nitrogen hydrolase family protein [Cellulomonas soli]|uniref:carbon-nitrogen hydrolase family protein n=1 Tax=Cellulomonas soli TaxID=931535 RepID=UPI003F826BC8